MTLALFGRRVGAFAIDVAILFALDFVIGISLSLSLSFVRTGLTIGELEERLRWPLIAAYFIGFWTLGATPGMRQMRLALEGLSGGRTTLIAAVIRFAVLGGLIAFSGATILLAFAPYLLVCAFGFYPHDVLARTTVRRETRSVAGATWVITKSAYAIGLMFFGLMVAGVVLGLAFGGFGERPR